MAPIKESATITKKKAEVGQSTNKVDKTEYDKSKAPGIIQMRYNRARQSSTFDFERFARYYKLFRNRQIKKNYAGLANLFVPEPYRIIRRKTAKLANAIKSIKVTPETPNDIESAKIGTMLLNFLRRKMDWFALERTAIQESRIIGLSWIKALWNVSQETEQKPYLGFDLSFETADKIFVDPDSNMLEILQGKCRWLIHEYVKTYQDLESNPNYEKDALQQIKLTNIGAKQETTPLSQARELFIHKSKQSDDQFRLHKIKEYWGKYVINDEEKDYLIVIADDRIVLRFEENPYKDIFNNGIPFVPIVANLIGQEMYPIGDIEPCESLFNELNDTRNQRMDTVTFNIDPAKEIVTGANIDERELIARRGWTIHSNIPNGIRFIPPDMQGVKAAVEEEQAIRGDIQQTTGILDFAQGSDVQAGVNIDTARGALIAKGESDVVIEDEINLLKMSLQQLYRIVLAYAQNFLDRNFTMRVLEEGVDAFYNVDKNAIAGNFDLDVEMETLQDKTTTQQLAILLFNQAKTIPGANIGKFFTDLLETFKEKINIKEYYEEPQPQGPPPPSINISLRGDLNPLQTSDIAVQAGAKPESGDPLLDSNLRELMRGNLPEHLDRQAKEMDIMQKQKEMMNPPVSNESQSSQQ